MNFNDFRELDKNLSEEERTEWNNIYSSYRSGSILSGTVSGVDRFGIDGKNMIAAVIINYRVKILIPEIELWEKEMPKNISHNLLGAQIEFIITNFDRENNCAAASRIAALKLRRKKFLAKKPKENQKVDCNILAVGRKRMHVECGGMDLSLGQIELCYAVIPDLRERYAAGDKLKAVIKEIDFENQKLKISARDANPHPYIGIKERHPRDCRRYTEITGKRGGLLFCRLEKDFDCLCKISGNYTDDEFAVGDKVVIVIKRHFDKNMKVFGTVISKWR